MPPVPEPRVPVQIDSDDEESLLLLANVERKLYSSFQSYHENSDFFPDEQIDEQQKQSSCLRRLWDSYYSLLEQQPLLVKSTTALFLLGLADFLAQMVEHLRGIPHESWVDVLRVMRFAICGFLGAPWTHYYYDWLDTVLPPTTQPWTMTTGVKVFIDQFIQAPALLALIISGLALMEGRGIDGMREDMEKEYVFSLIQNWKLWIPATIINIAFVSPTLRVLYDNLVFLVWTIWLSMILSDSVKSD